MPFHLSFPDLPKVIVIRVKPRRTLARRSTDGNGTSPNEPIPSILSTELNNPYSQEASPGSPNRVATGSSLQRISEIAQIGLPTLQSLVGAVPVAGTALGAAIGGLLSVLQFVNVSMSHVRVGHATSLTVTETRPK